MAMKKLFTLVVATLAAVGAFAQTVLESKTFDNVYIGINGGVATKATGHTWMNGLNPNAGLRIGRYFTPVFGLAVESNAYFSNKPWTSDGTAVRALNTSLLGTVNLTNWFGGYKGAPRLFEVSALYGLGWGHTFGTKSNAYDLGKSIGKANGLTSKAGLDLAFNLGEKKAWQIYVEPAVVWGLNGLGYDGVKYNVNRAFAQLNAGVVYKFKNSNGTHNFKVAQLRDQSEIDGLNSQINDLRAELAKKPKEVVKTVVETVQASDVEHVVFVTFAQGKSNLTAEAKKILDTIAEGCHVQVVGTASPEGSKKLNDRLSQDRANSVAAYLQTKGVNVDDAVGKGVQGKTSNRLAIVYVKK